MDFLYQNVLSQFAFSVSSALYPTFIAQANGSWYAKDFCPDLDDDVCWTHLMMGPNLDNMLIRLTIQNKKTIFEMSESGSVGTEISSGTFYCININIANENGPSQSGSGNGIEAVIDLETFDNGDIGVTGDGADILVTNPGEYSLAQLKGFSASPVSAVEIRIRPEIFSITDSGLAFDYLDRKCVDTSIDKRDLLKGAPGVESYSLSNCLVAAAMTEIQNK